MKHANTGKLYDYWNTLRNGRVAPYRREIDPREIAPLLESTFILEVQDLDSIRFRLAGTRLCENFGMELRGMSALALWHGECREKVQDAIQRVVEEPSVAYLNCRVENRGGFSYDSEFLYMPLKSDDEQHNRILGCGYYMAEEGAFTNLYAPTHHWVEHVEVWKIDADHGVDVSGFASTSTFGSALPLKASIPVRKTKPILTALPGGRALKMASPSRSRTHLRVVKDEAS